MNYESPEIRIEKFELSEEIANIEASSTVLPDGPIEEENIIEEVEENAVQMFIDVFNIK